METEAIDKLYLELSQFTAARNKRELAAVRKIRAAVEELDFLEIDDHLNNAFRHLIDARNILEGPWRESP